MCTVAAAAFCGARLGSGNSKAADEWVRAASIVAVAWTRPPRPPLPPRLPALVRSCRQTDEVWGDSERRTLAKFVATNFIRAQPKAPRTRVASSYP
eukprot:scaffold114196_cov63-Phaeocystis_antarctica.AAC.8